MNARSGPPTVYPRHNGTIFLNVLTTFSMIVSLSFQLPPTHSDFVDLAWAKSISAKAIVRYVTN